MLADEILRRNPSIVFHVGVGMSAVVIALASLRLAPVQCTSFGHTATTMSPAIDAMILPEGFVGARECFSERVVTVPWEAMPFMPPPTPPTRQAPKARDGVLRVAVVASVMKHNARLHDVFRRIATTAKAAFEFHFFPAFAVGLVHQELARAVCNVLPNAIVHAESPRSVYFERLATCDMFLCPFPYGNMNGIVDAVSLGMPGICLDGAEAHAHADAAFFARAGLPADLVTGTIDEYVAAAVRLIDDTAWRLECQRIVAACDLDRAFFKDDSSLFCRAIAELVGPSVESGASRRSEPA
jgi:predicted O-linked N-acetylglucosamine transferase (SPINDLY family)